MKIQVWSDFRCPFCFIGKKNLDEAIKKVNHEIEIEMMSYELDPTYQPTPGQSYAERLSASYGMSLEQAQSQLNNVVRMAKEAGLNYDLENMIDVNSFKIHQVFQLAKEKGMGSEFFDLGMSAHFEQARDLSDLQVLIELGQAVGLREEQVKQAVQSDDLGYKVRSDQAHARNIGVKGVPHFLIDDKVFVSGAQPMDSFVNAIKYVESLTSSPDMSCSDESCVV